MTSLKESVTPLLQDGKQNFDTGAHWFEYFKPSDGSDLGKRRDEWADGYIQDFLNFMNADNLIYDYPPNGSEPYIYAIRKALKFLNGESS
jgi:hypothetical protein